VHEVPPPELQPGGILVRTYFSVISSGTERASVQTAEKSLIGKAMSRPDLVRQVFDYAHVHGVRAAYQKVRSQLDALKPLGYSCSGVVLETGEGVTEFSPGERVACGGAGYANHSEVNFVPRNLVVPVPPMVPLEHAALTTIGAIAMQGVRQGQVSFGETVVVVGAGLLGVLAVQLAKAAGCRVVAIDLDPERVRRALELGAHAAFAADDPRLPERVKEFSRYGADVALITAASRSAAPLEMATRLLRDRGRAVVVGDVGLDVPRAALYLKELSVTLSRSYGPGRYDPVYEEKGIDYPIGYVRWTEKRNMEAFLGLLATGALNVAPLLARECSVEEAAQAYEELREGRAYTVLLRYPFPPASSPLPVTKAATVAQPRARTSLRIGSIGAGSFARSVIFPNLQKAAGVALEAVASASGAETESARKAVGFSRALTARELLSDPNVEAVFVLTRHDSHARYVLEALRQGKPVYVEKPLCSNPAELTAIRQAYATHVEAGKNPFVMVGLNRRFAPLTERVKEFFAGRQEQMVVHVRVNAGYVPRDHWAQQTEGGRIVGEVCHFVDWARFVIGCPIKGVRASALPDGTRYHRDNLVATLLFDDESIASLLYLANGDKAVPKEYFEVFCEGGVARLEDFTTLELVRMAKRHTSKSTQDKGHRKELALTVSAMRSGQAAPIPFAEICEVTEATFRIEEALRKPSFAELAATPSLESTVETSPRSGDSSGSRQVVPPITHQGG
jgi:predicted dehydrogenase/threonine dehydrogenase-like Zn-dependent dehydrogenase